jgi:hypothetical protein
MKRGWQNRQMVRHRGAAIFLLLPCFLLTFACSRPVGLHGGDGAAQSDATQVPFQEGQGLENEASSRREASAAKLESDLPFHDSKSLPVGTLVTVRLKSSISTDAPDASGTFEALVEEPITVEGNTVVPRGASVSGRVESARASRIKGNRNYIRLRLDSIDVAGRDLPVQTSSLFTHGMASVTALSPNANPAAVIQLEKGHRLTFRLTEPVYLASQQPVTSR